MFFGKKKTELPTADQALPGRSTEMPLHDFHAVFGVKLKPPFAAGSHEILIGMGCFWGVERKFWQTPGVISTSVGYSAGFTPNPTYQEVCTGMTGHNEVVRVIYDPSVLSIERVLQLFWESHNPTQGMRQGNDAGTQYRSGIYFSRSEQKLAAELSKQAYQRRLTAAGLGTISTEILAASAFYYAENEHQQYLAKNPGGYCGLGGTGVSCPIGANLDAQFPLADTPDR
jgi:peptide-methionine (S)-S-oxide reductase